MQLMQQQLLLTLLLLLLLLLPPVLVLQLRRLESAPSTLAEVIGVLA